MLLGCTFKIKVMACFIFVCYERLQWSLMCSQTRAFLEVSPIQLLWQCRNLIPISDMVLVLFPANQIFDRFRGGGYDPSVGVGQIFLEFLIRRQDHKFCADFFFFFLSVVPTFLVLWILHASSIALKTKYSRDIAFACPHDCSCRRLCFSLKYI